MITIDWNNLTVESTSSITDIVAFHDILRDNEDSETGILYPVIHKWKRIDLGSGAYFYALDFINSWRLKFPNAGSYEIVGNINAEIIMLPSVYVERKTSAAFSTTTVGSVGFTPEDVAEAIWQRLLTGQQVPGSAGSMIQDISARIASQ